MVLPAFGIDGSTAIVTGASSGIGKAIALQFARQGIDVAICSRDQDRVDQVATEANEKSISGSILSVECDVRDSGAVDAFVDRTVDEFGGIDVLVNNAAGTFRCDFEDLSENAWKTIIDINLHGTFHCTQAAGSYMRESGHGSIVNFSSVAAFRGSPRTSHYAASKAAIVNLTESLAIEWAPDGIRVNCVAPGLIATPPVVDRLDLDDSAIPERETVDRRLGTVDEIADIVQFLVSPAASFMTGETVRPRGVPPVANHDPS
jgi:NAD(P)-dependent dehydrogenase (short-subunit alcohol dehydrogenase family)